MNPIKFRLTLQSRSMQAGALILILAALSAVQPAVQAQGITWQNVLERLFGRQQQKGGTREPNKAFCAVTPILYSGGPRASSSRLLLSEKPLIAWYGEVATIRLRNRTTKKEWTSRDIQPNRSNPEKGKPILNQLQYDGEPLVANQDYDLFFQSALNIKGTDQKEIIDRVRFRTLSQSDRNRIKFQLRNIAATAAETGASDPTLSQVEFLLQQNLVNDAQMLILQQSSPSSELTAAITATQNPCEAKLTATSPKPTASTPAAPSPAAPTNP
jgi:hypothetical protein